ncbi:MAG: hypothetical protein M1817_004693 [Caeruleum heppii]|nr:MAG: hypothetical protein M1817_004693 [Caeruleum heppii]
MDPSNGKKNADLPAVAGIKRPAPSPLLPAFEPSSSPSLPRPIKRLARNSPADQEHELKKYPTPAATSELGILSSSPPPMPRSRPGLQRTQSALSERAPLSAVPSVTLPADGEPVLMGRSSNSSHYQLSANRLISRVHVRAAYVPATTPLGPSKVEVICTGWNGCKVHCQGRAWDLGKGDSFTSETEHDIMLDVQDARVLLSWPPTERQLASSAQSDATWDDENSPRRVLAHVQDDILSSSPLRRRHGLESPVSPSPGGPSNLLSSSTILPSDATLSHDPVVVYEDEPPSNNDLPDTQANPTTQSTQVLTQPLTQPLTELTDASQSSGLSEPQEFSDQDEENDPIIQAFGSQGDNILPRMASFNTNDSPEPLRRSRPVEILSSVKRRSSSESTNEAALSSLANHVINQLAFSRLSSTPMSTILSHLPAEFKAVSPEHQENKPFSKGELQTVLESTACIGKITREGKDAAGKPLESEYYYIPDTDTDEKRRDAVVGGLQKPGLRACRKQHKVCH